MPKPSCSPSWARTALFQLGDQSPAHQEPASAASSASGLWLGREEVGVATLWTAWLGLGTGLGVPTICSSQDGIWASWPRGQRRPSGGPRVPTSQYQTGRRLPPLPAPPCGQLSGALHTRCLRCPPDNIQVASVTASAWGKHVSPLPLPLPAAQDPLATPPGLSRAPPQPPLPLSLGNVNTP